MLMLQSIQTSPLFSSIQPGDKITHVADCSVTDSESWTKCLLQIVEPSFSFKGYCRETHLVKEAGFPTHSFFVFFTLKMVDQHFGIAQQNDLACCNERLDQDKFYCFEIQNQPKVILS